MSKTGLDKLSDAAVGYAFELFRTVFESDSRNKQYASDFRHMLEDELTKRRSIAQLRKIGYTVTEQQTERWDVT